MFDTPIVRVHRHGACINQNKAMARRQWSTSYLIVTVIFSEMTGGTCG
jgi:hypothetical protein